MPIQIEQGNTLRLEIEFLDFDNKPVEPQNVQFKVYNLKYTELVSINLDINNKVRDLTGEIIPGKYYIDYVFNKTGTYLIEFIGYVENKPTLKREKIAVVFY